LKTITKQYQMLLEAHLKIERILIVSARPLLLEEKEELERRFKEILGDKTILEYKLDSSLLGGIRVYLRNILIDDSLVTQMSKMALMMKGTD